ncbi:hypothetical protein H9649_06880 [Sporosarcina sp. Sa2YVA2]|uniref:Uncharacterized protein n=2 Tax=Sporosarcina quadrami TaxID=2762234 RepID=A0ABR8U8D0_9BACL|nr:hypothetical protein [Sporosarcina quadrami]
MILILLGIFIAFITIILFFIVAVMFIISCIKKKPFPKKSFIAMLIGVVLVASIYVYKVYFYTFDTIDKTYMQDGPGPVLSPDEAYSVSAYFEPYGGAAGGVNVWVELTNRRNDNSKKIIYYSDANDNIQLDWVDENTLFITNAGPYNNSVKLDVEAEIYHDRGLACRSWLMKEEYERCYQK